jgi:ribosomal subunit interface protein
VDIVVKGRHCEISDRFRRHVQEKLAKVEKLDPKVIRIDVEVSKEHNPRLSDVSQRIELTVASRGPVIRAEAAADDPYAALDMAWSKLETRLRRARDRRRVHHGGKTPTSLAVLPSVDGSTSGWSAVKGAAASAAAAAPEDQTDLAAIPAEVLGAPESQADEGPFVLREKVHEAIPMTLDQALYEMELVGHDFFLFVDAATEQPSVVYRRRGYSYGVIRLAV